MENHQPPQYPQATNLSPEELRNEFLVTGLFRPGEISLHWWETDRTVMGGICPAAAALPLHSPDAMRAAFFFERREAGVLNLGGPGTVAVDGTTHALENLDALYIGRGAKQVSFASR